MTTTKDHPVETQAQASSGQMPDPTPEHQWLQRFAGEWQTEAEMFMEPGQPPTKSAGMESGRMLGGFWLLADGKSTSPEMPFSYRLTLGYDPKIKKYVGTWVDSMTSYLWKYEGTVDPTGSVLSLETQGFLPNAPDKRIPFREVTEFKSETERHFTSSMQGEDGNWVTILKVRYRRTG